MSAVDLKITGEVASLRLEPGDRIIVTLHDPHILDKPAVVDRIREQLQMNFPGHEAILLVGLSIAREVAP